MAACRILFGVLVLGCLSAAEIGIGPELPPETSLGGAYLHAEEEAADLVKLKTTADSEEREIQRLESDQAALYAQKKQQIDKARQEIKNMNVKRTRPNEHQMTLALDEVLHEERSKLSYSNRTKRSAIPAIPQDLWLDGVNYFFDPAFSQTGRDFLKMAIRFYEANTCIRFREVDPNDPAFSSKIRVYEGPGCFSMIGKFTGVQDLSLASWCWRFDSSCHEMGHSLGFVHHHMRSDRDDWIWVDLDNVDAQYKSQYSKWTSSNNLEMRYDYRSIMHYWSTLWAKDPSRDVMVAYDSKYQMAIGASQVPTFTDIAGLNRLYSCNACAGSAIKCARGGYPHPNDCTRCHCPSGFGGNDCTQRAPASPAWLNCGQTLTATGQWQTLQQNRVCGDGQHVTANITSPSTCFYHIQAPAGHRIEYWVNFIGFDGASDALCYAQCRYGGLNLKGHDTNWQPEGYRFCCPSQLAERLVTVGDLLVVEAFNNFRYTDFQITYRIDPCGAALTATPSFQWYTSNYGVGNGKYEAADRNNPTTCTWTIEAPAGSKLLYAVNFVGFDGNRSALCYWDCWYGAVEVQGDQRLKYCCPQQESQLVRNAGNKLTVTVTNIFRYTEFKIQYAIDPCANVPTVCYNGGVPDPNSCGRCACLPGFAGTDCSVRAPPSGGASCGQIILASTNWQWFAQNNVVGWGSWTPLDRNNPAMCTYIVEAPAGKRIEYEMNFVGFDGNENGLCTPGCANGGVVVRGHGAFWQPEGINFCCHNDYNQRRTSGTNLLVLQAWNSLRYTDFQIAYRVV